MPKRKLEVGPGQGELAEQLAETAPLGGSKPKKPCSFSIEAIMGCLKRPQGVESGSGSENEENGVGDENHYDSDSLSPSESNNNDQLRQLTSGAALGSRSASPASSVRSSSVTSAASSRPSTPISPGCPSADLYRDELQPMGPTSGDGQQQANMMNTSGSPISGGQQFPQAPNQQSANNIPVGNQQQKSAGKARNSSGGGSSWSKERGGGSTNHLLRQPVCTDPKLTPFECHLDNLDLWHKFNPLDTEMIITKQGR